VPSDFLEVIVYNSLGQKVIEINTSNQQSSYYIIDLAGMGSGMYFLKMRFTNHTELHKIIIL